MPALRIPLMLVSSAPNILRRAFGLSHSKWFTVAAQRRILTGLSPFSPTPRQRQPKDKENLPAVYVRSLEI